MKLTRHNGRAGKNGAYNPKHNDRRFDIENSEHIDVERAKQNIYWDCYTGFSPYFLSCMDSVFHKMLTLPLCTKDGYEFIGWYDDDVCAGQAGGKYTVSGDVILKAKSGFRLVS